MADELPYITACKNERMRITRGCTYGWITEMLQRFDGTAKICAYETTAIAD